MSAQPSFRSDSRVEFLRVPPHSIDAEQSVLGGLMLSPDAWAKVSDLLAADDFYRRDHQQIFRAIAELAEANKPRDAVTVGDWLNSRGLLEIDDNGAYVCELAANIPSAANVEAYAEIVRDKAGMRKLIEVGTETVGACFQPDGRDFAELLNEAQRRVSDLQPTQQGGLRRASETLRGWWEKFSERYERGERMTGLPTPWHDVNDLTHGLQPGTAYLVAARPSMGKSVFGLNLATFSALRGVTTGFFSLEMSAESCHSRNVASQADVPHDFVIAPSEAADDGYLARMTPAIRDLQRAPLFIDDTPSLTVRQFEARARRMHMREKLGLLVIDHLHEFRIDPKLARFELGGILHTARALGREWGIPVVVLAQLNRRVATATEKRPTLGDLRESGELEQKADVVLFLHREDYYDTDEKKTHLQGVVEIIPAKGRDLKVGKTIHLRNRFDVMRLDDWEGSLPRAPEPERVVRQRGMPTRGSRHWSDNE